MLHYTTQRVVLQGKLAALAAHAQYSQLGGDTSWRRGRLADDAVAIVAAARQHEHAHALQVGALGCILALPAGITCQLHPSWSA